MKLLMGYSDGEIAAKLGLTKTAVSTRVSRGRRLLRGIVEREGFLLDAQRFRAEDSRDALDLL